MESSPPDAGASGLRSLSEGGSVPVRSKNAQPAPEETVLPPGQRDRTGFWVPSGYDDPRTLVNRRVRRTRLGSGGNDDAPAESAAD